MDQHQPTLLDAIESFIETQAMSAITFGRKAMNDPHFVRDLRDGRDIKVSTAARVAAFMATYDAAAHCPLCDAARAAGEIAACTQVDCPVRQREAA